MSLILLGTGSSHGIPAIACDCHTCNSTDPHDKRMRTSALIRCGEINILIDCGCDMREQLLREKVENLNAVIITHTHADHIYGIDDLRSYSKNKNLPVYAKQEDIDDIKKHFPYMFHETLQKGGGKPRLEMIPINGEFYISGIKFTPFPLIHGGMTILGFRFGNIAYVTDANKIPEETYQYLHGLQTLIINGLWIEPHWNHFCFSESLDEIGKIQPKQAYIIHIHHNNTHQEIEDYIQKEKQNRPALQNIDIHPGYDGQVINGINI